MSTPEPPAQPARQPALSYDALAEEQIQSGYAAGQFANLPGYGTPLPDYPEEEDEDWWIKDKLRRENISILPPGLEILRDVEKTLASLPQLLSERAVRRELTALNERIREANFRSVSGPPSTQLPIDVEATVTQWRQGQKRVC